MISVYVLPEIALVGYDGVAKQDLGDKFVISIVSPGREHPKIIGTNVHKFHFHDVSERYDLPDGRIILPMSESIAKEIVDIVMKNRECAEWIIHCEAGISRSPGVAIGLSKYIKMNPNRRMLKKAFPMYNKYVCKLVEEAMEEKMKEIDKKLVTGVDGWEGF